MQDILYALDVGSEGGAMDLQPMLSGACTPRRSESLGLQVMPISPSRGNDWDGRRLVDDVCAAGPAYRREHVECGGPGLDDHRVVVPEQSRAPEHERHVQG